MVMVHYMQEKTIMKKSRAVLLLLVLILARTIPLFAAPNTATAERYMTSANEQYGLENFSKAYTYINYVLEQYDEKTVTLQVKLLAELIYYDYLDDIGNKKDLEAFKGYQDSVNDFPYIVSDRIQKKLDSLVPEFKKLEEEEQKKKAQAAQAAQQQQATAQRTQQAATTQSTTEIKSTIQASNEELSKKIESLEQLIITQETQQQVQQIREELSNSIQNIRQSEADSASKTRILVIVLIAVVLILITIIVSIIVIVLRMSRRQKELFTTTLRIVSEIKKLPLEISNTTTLRIEDKYNELRKIQEEAAAAAAEQEQPQEEEEPPVPPSIPKVEDKDITEDLRSELRELANNCEEQGINIDKHTGRKNNSRKIAELVFKIAKEMDLGEYYSMLYFCASMVYDIGFLDNKAELFEEGEFSEEQKAEIRNHVHTGVDRLDFVPEKFRPIFVDAVCMHHENNDGSGYPDGVKEKRIPDVARMIHVVESYISMISKRTYHKIFDQEAAIDTLKQAPEKYDQAIVTILEDVI